MKSIKRAAVITACVSILYVALSYFLSKTEYTFRTWISILGNVTAALILPLLLIIILLLSAYEHNWKGRGILTGVMVAAYAFFGYWTVLFLVIGTEEEKRLTESLLVTDEGGFLNGSHYVYYRPVAFLFKTPSGLTDEAKVEYLEKKYHREFITDPGRDGRLCDKEFSEVKVSVYLSDGELADDYVEGMVIKYLLDGYEALGMKRGYFLSDNDRGRNGHLYMEFGNEGDVPAVSQDIEQLIVYVLDQTDFFMDKNCSIRFYCKSSKGGITGEIPFGKSNSAAGSCSIPNSEEIENSIWEVYRCFFDSSDMIRRTEEGDDDQVQNIGENPELETDYREKAARVLYDTFFAQEGYSYKVCYNAKGNLYIDLGSKAAQEFDDGKIQYYRLVYDRPSKNGACELFVLYRSSGESDSEVIVDMYAVESDTGRAIVSGKKTWSDVGTEEYREITGE